MQNVPKIMKNRQKFWRNGRRVTGGAMCLLIYVKSFFENLEVIRNVTHPHICFQSSLTSAVICF